MTECIFCKIAGGEIPAKKVYEDPSSIAFLDINPRNPGHCIVTPKKHCQDILTIPESQAADLMKAITRVAKGMQKATGTRGISIIQNSGQMAGQVVPHIFFHVIPRTEAEKGAALESVIPVKPQDQASLDAMARKISQAIPNSGAKREEPRKAEPEPEKEEPVEEPAPKKKPEGKGPEDQKITFDF